MANREISLPFDGDRLRHYRERGGLLQADVARLCAEAGHKVDRTRISQLERGDKPSPPLLAALARVFDIEIDDLLAPEGEQVKEAS